MTPPDHLDLPTGLDAWQVAFVEHAQVQNAILRANGAEAHATARESLLRMFVEYATRWFEAEVSVGEAASITRKSEETIRRAVRDGRLPDRRASGRGHHRMRRGDLAVLEGRAQAAYDPATDAQDIAQLRRRA